MMAEEPDLVAPLLDIELLGFSFTEVVGALMFEHPDAPLPEMPHCVAVTAVDGTTT